MPVEAALLKLIQCCSRGRCPEPCPRDSGGIFCLDICTYYFAWEPIEVPVHAAPVAGIGPGCGRQPMNPMHSSSFIVYGYSLKFVRCPLGLFVTVFVLFINLRPMELTNGQIHACGMRIQ